MNIYKSVFKTAIVTLACLSAGCATTTTDTLIQQPTVELSGVVLDELNFSGQTVLLSFDVSNPNPYPLPVRAVRYHVQLDDESFARGETVGEFSVPAGGDGQFAISVELDVLKSMSSLTSVLKDGVHKPINYELIGSLALDLPLVKPVPFSTTGLITIASN